MAWVPVVAITGRCSGFTVLSSYLSLYSVPATIATELAPTMDISPELPDEELQQSFIGVLGKPYKSDDLAGLLALARAVRSHVCNVPA
jgi:hypothetical protein